MTKTTSRCNECNHQCFTFRNTCEISFKATDACIPEFTYLGEQVQNEFGEVLRRGYEIGEVTKLHFDHDEPMPYGGEISPIHAEKYRYKLVQIMQEYFNAGHILKHRLDCADEDFTLEDALEVMGIDDGVDFNR